MMWLWHMAQALIPDVTLGRLDDTPEQAEPQRAIGPGYCAMCGKATDSSDVDFCGYAHYEQWHDRRNRHATQ